MGNDAKECHGLLSMKDYSILIHNCFCIKVLTTQQVNEFRNQNVIYTNLQMLETL